MTASAFRLPRIFSAEEYLLIERNATFKSEYLYGTIYGMAGASENHITINANLTAIAVAALRGSGCRVFGNDMKVRTTPEGLFAYTASRAQMVAQMRCSNASLEDE